MPDRDESTMGQSPSETNSLPQDQPQLIRYLESIRADLVLSASNLYPYGAEDCVQAAILQAIDRIGDFRGRTVSELFAWTKKIVINNCLAQIRRKENTHRREFDLYDKRDSEMSTPSEHLRREEELARIAGALEQLPEDQRSAVIYGHLMDLNREQIALLLNKSEPAVAGLMARGMKKLRSLLSESEFSVLLGN